MLRFTVFHNESPIKTYETSDVTITIGRLPENTIPIASISISRRHVRLTQNVSLDYVLTDLNSLNGTFVNDKKVSEIIIKDDDKITIGKYAIVINIATNDEEYIDTAIINTNNNPIDDDAYPKTESRPVVEEFIDLDLSDNTNTAVLIETNTHVTYKIDKPIMSIGSSENDDIFVEGFLITDGHVLIELENNVTWIHANKLMGRFKINGKKENKHKLHHKDRIEIGTSTFRYMENGQQ